MTYRKDTKTVLYRSKMNPNLKRNFALFPVLDWIAAITAHIPNKGGANSVTPVLLPHRSAVFSSNGP